MLKLKKMFKKIKLPLEHQVIPNLQNHWLKLNISKRILVMHKIFQMDNFLKNTITEILRVMTIQVISEIKVIVDHATQFLSLK